jgi:hypothetical protein
MTEPTIADVMLLQLAGDDTVLCALVAASGRVVAVVNSRYPEAEVHARQHIAVGFEDVLICNPDCDGSRR